MNGFNVFHPDDIAIDSTLPTVLFSDFKLFYESQIPQHENSVLKKDVNYTEEITLRFDQNIIGIEFLALDLLAPHKNKYEYILESFDMTWYNLGSVRQATYTNLSPGSYTFRVKACNADDVWTTQSKDLKITILPPWWMTWWFRLLATVSVLGAVAIIAFRRSYLMRLQNRLLEEKVRQRTEELVFLNTDLQMHKEELQTNNETLQHLISTKDRLFTIIAHDLKNPLNALIGFSDLLVRNWSRYTDDKKQQFVGLINTSSNNLFLLLENLLDWSRSQTGEITVLPKLISLSDVIVENVNLLKVQADKKEICLIDKTVLSVNAFVDMNMINTVVRNLLSNAIKYTPSGGDISLLVEPADDGMVSLSIKDTGVGMEQKHVDTLFKISENISTPGTAQEKGTGLGLIVCKEFVDKNNGQILVFSELGKGTQFRILLPATE